MGILSSIFSRPIVNPFVSSSMWHSSRVNLGHVDRIQAAMLEALNFSFDDCPELVRQVTTTRDIRKLWYLRCDVMSAISIGRTERMATAIMEPISLMFEEFLPRSMHSRPSPEQRRQARHREETMTA